MQFVDYINIPGADHHIEVHTNTIERHWRSLKKSIRCARDYINADGDLIEIANSYIDQFKYFHNR